MVYFLHNLFQFTLLMFRVNLDVLNSFILQYQSLVWISTFSMNIVLVLLCKPTKTIENIITECQARRMKPLCLKDGR